MVRLLVRDASPSHVFRADGARFREAIQLAWSDAEPLEVDFQSERIASASFFDESFGMLALAHPLDVIRRRLRPTNLSDADRDLLNSIVARRARERLDRLERLTLGELARLSGDLPRKPVSPSNIATGTTLREEEVREAVPSLVKSGLIKQLPKGDLLLTSKGKHAAQRDPVKNGRTGSASFKDAHRELQELARELQVLRSHNLQFKEGDSQRELLFFAEAALVCMTLERFVRAVLGPEATDADSLYNLLQKAVSRGLLRMPWADQQDGIKRIAAVRNTLLHGNYEQAAREAGSKSIAEYFRTQFAGEVQSMFDLTEYVIRQIDPATGSPISSSGPI